MIDRLANVLYWTACALALALIVLGFGYYSTTTGLRPGFLVLVLVVAFVIWLIGRAVRYVLSGV